MRPAHCPLPLVLFLAGLAPLSAGEPPRPATGDRPAPPSAATTAAPRASERDSSAKVDLNTADPKALEAIAAIGPDGARAIVAARPFASVDELSRVPGLGAERLEQIRAQVYVSGTVARNPLGEPTHQPQPLGLPAAAASPTGRIDVNTADLATLEAIPVIGPELARELVAARPFRTLDELSRVRDLSAERLEQLKSVLVVAPASAPAARPARASTPTRSR
jgi:DNA uptake protein ComE-like DNA-binding protein